MAKRETITGKAFDSGGLVADFTRPCWNIHNLVGEPGINDPGDVMVIQAMLLRIAFSGMPGFDPFFDKFIVSSLSLSVNGEFDLDTSNAIKSYQEFRSSFLIAGDGLIHPADYKGRTITIRLGFPVRLMTITRLHFDCVEANRFVGGKDYTMDFKLLHPQLFFFV